MTMTRFLTRARAAAALPVSLCGLIGYGALGSFRWFLLWTDRLADNVFADVGEGRRRADYRGRKLAVNGGEVGEGPQCVQGLKEGFFRLRGGGWVLGRFLG